MTTRIPNADALSTRDLLGEVLRVILPSDQNNQTEGRALFLVEAGTAYHVCARLRTMLSRQRAMLERRGRKPKRFQLSSSVHPETHDGIRYDAIVMWREMHQSHMMLQRLEDIMSEESARV